MYPFVVYGTPKVPPSHPVRKREQNRVSIDYLKDGRRYLGVEG
jgi:hypothetical protein